MRGEIKRLIINVPPRSLKSLAASVALPAWWLGHYPSAHILSVTYGQDLSNNLALDSRTIMQSPWYQRTFRTRLSTQKAAVQDFRTTRGGSRFATSIGGTLTGRGADVIIIDDPLKPDEALSDTQRENVNHWYSHTLVSRLNDKKNGCIIVIMQRLHEDDLVGHLMEQEGWEVLSLPAIALRDEIFEFETPYGAQWIERKEGDLLHPEREPVEVLQRMRAELGEAHFSAQYLQTPAPPGGGMIKEGWFKRYAAGGEPSRFDRIVQSWDTANKPTELADYSVCTTWGMKGKQLYLLHVHRERLDFPSLKRKVLELQARYNARTVIIEDKASGIQLIQDLRRDGIYGVKQYETQLDKVMRAHAVSGTIESGLVWVPTQAYWLADYMKELLAFPKSKHDDQVDSTTQFLDWVSNGRGPDYEALSRW